MKKGRNPGVASFDIKIPLKIYVPSGAAGLKKTPPAVLFIQGVKFGIFRANFVSGMDIGTSNFAE